MLASDDEDSEEEGPGLAVAKEHGVQSEVGTSSKQAVEAEMEVQPEPEPELGPVPKVSE
eukprot:COSAG01_NODE_76943_length_174_cov_268.466667_1_plen_58_part_11